MKRFLFGSILTPNANDDMDNKEYCVTFKVDLDIKKKKF